MAYGIARLGESAARLSGFPHTTNRGLWQQSAHGRWTAGFWIGQLWLAYLNMADDRWLHEAERWARRLEARKDDKTTHDMGFLFQPSFVRGWKITRDSYYRDVALAACASHASRFNEVGRFLPAWDPSEDPIFAGRTIVDTVMNLPILFWGAREANRPEWEEIARAVSATIRQHHVRPDGSTFHVVDFDPASGKPVAYTTHQGYSATSCWSRGHAWALYGFALVSRWSGNPDDLSTSRKLADYFIAHLPEDFVPYWDFQAPGIPDEPRDSAAAAIGASGLLELAQILDGPAGESYRQAALEILGHLIDRCLSRGYPDQEGILLHATVDLPRQSAIDESTIYGDHYFLEALCKALHPERWALL